MLSTIDYFVIGLYLFFIVLISVLFRFKTFRQVFGEDKKIPWWLGGVSLLMLTVSTSTPQLESGIIHRQGISGLWFLWSDIIGKAVLPIFFASLWARMSFITDNQFILFRFSGSGAKILHQFRAIYVGGIIATFLVSFLVLSFTKILYYFFEIEKEACIVITALLLIMSCFKNSFHQKIRTDVFNAILYFTTISIAAFYIIDYAGGLVNIVHNLKTNAPEKINIIPQSNFFETLSFNTFLVYILIQWWSAGILDGGGTEAQRFINVKNSFHAFKASVFPIIILSLFAWIIIMINLSGLSISQHQNIIPSFDGEQDYEGVFIILFTNYLPVGLKGLALVAFFSAFITTAESFLNWGASFITVDFYRTYRSPDRDEKHYVRVAFGLMILMSVIASLIAYFNTHIQFLITFLFSITAGVGVVFILRWFWWRINAWSQLSAMISSLIYTLTFELLYVNNKEFSSTINSLTGKLGLEYYSLKLLLLTTLVTLTWLVTTYSTKPDDYGHLKKFAETVKPGGVWPNGIESGYLRFGRKFLSFIFLIAINLLIIVSGWYFIFRF